MSRANAPSVVVGEMRRMSLAPGASASVLGIGESTC